MKSKIPSAIILSLGLGFAGYFVGQGFLGSKLHSQSVEVKGLAERTVKSDEAVWTINFKFVNNDLSQLYEGVSKSQAEAKKFLLAEGFKEQEIFMNPISVVDNQSVGYNQNQDIPRFSADSGITLSTQNVDLVASALQKTGSLVKQGVVVTSSNATFRFTNLNDIKRPMLEEATQNARNVAESFAKDSQTTLGNIRHASQGLFTISDANSNYDSGYSLMKKVRVVSTIEYQLNGK
jgi:hypothetical protein